MNSEHGEPPQISGTAIFTGRRGIFGLKTSAEHREIISPFAEYSTLLSFGCFCLNECGSWVKLLNSLLLAYFLITVRPPLGLTRSTAVLMPMTLHERFLRHEVRPVWTLICALICGTLGRTVARVGESERVAELSALWLIQGGAFPTEVLKELIDFMLHFGDLYHPGFLGFGRFWFNCMGIPFTCCHSDGTQETESGMLSPIISFDYPTCKKCITSVTEQTVMQDTS